MTETERPLKMPRLGTPPAPVAAEPPGELTLTLTEFRNLDKNQSLRAEFLANIRGFRRVSVIDSPFQTDSSRKDACLRGLQSVLSECSPSDLALFVCFSVSSLSPGEPGPAIFDKVCKMQNLERLSLPGYSERQGRSLLADQITVRFSSASWPRLQVLSMGSASVSSHRGPKPWHKLPEALFSDHPEWDLAVLHSFSASCLASKQFAQFLSSFQLTGYVGPSGLPLLTSALACMPALRTLCTSMANNILCSGPTFSENSQDFFRQLGSMASLSTLGVCMRRLSKKDCELCTLQLKRGCAPITDFSIPSNSTDVERLSCMHFPPTVQSLRLAVNNLSSQPFGQLLECVPGEHQAIFFNKLAAFCHSLVKLDLSACCLHWHGFMALRKFLQIFPGSLLELNIACNYMDRRDTKELAAGLLSATSLTKLSLSNLEEQPGEIFGNLMYQSDFTVEFEQGNTFLQTLWYGLCALRELESLTLLVSGDEYDLDIVQYSIPTELPRLRSLTIFGRDLKEEDKKGIREAFHKSDVVLELND